MLEGGIQMKKIVWIYSVNLKGMGLYGNSTTMPLRQAQKFQETIKTNLPSDVTVDFISYDTSSTELPKADLIVYNDIDSRYLSDDLKNNGIVIPFKDMISNNTREIEKKILLAIK
ncbi:hypothetical protein IV424_13025 [Enterococcus faecalis]|nr:hypothetical protein [Enterococcus faecalis]